MAGHQWFRSYYVTKFIFLIVIATLAVCYLYYDKELKMWQTSYSFKTQTKNFIISQDQDTKIKQEQSRRMTLLKEYCRRNSSLSTIPLNTAVFIVNEKQKIIYCRAGKTGSSTTATVLYNLEHDYNMTVRQVNKQKEKLPFRLLSRHFYSEEEISFRLLTYNSLIVARNPLERLASAWMDKFVRNSQLGYNDRYQSMLETLNSSINGIQKAKRKNRPTTRQVPFLAFLRAAAASEEQWSDGHWMPISDVCAPCRIHYDYIAHTETLAEDLRLFLRKAGVTDRDHILPETKETRTERSLLDVYRVVSLEDLRKVMQKFVADYEMFGYSYQKDVLRLSHP
ncbi:carbohydrate sulfotransferase 10-like [Branchiostoma lanceolatum]|uniref:carbohydrate sulfotransferase 10-like n=1 Tax=Branchiostoma lanceolatum TaxID=7740 RepID=UPI003454109F